MKNLLLPFALIAAAAAPIAPLTITAPTNLAAPDPGSVRVAGLTPGERTTLIASRRAGLNTATATATFIADSNGQIDTARQAPVTGSYAGVDPLGLYWSARPRAATAEDPPAGETLVTVRADNRVAVSAPAHRLPDPDRLAIRRDTPFPGAVYVRPQGRGRHPVIIVLGGSEGGGLTAEQFAPIFAAQGYATLGLPYYSPGYLHPGVAGLPTTFNEIPVDRLVAVRDWLAQQDDAETDRIGLWGVSKGSEFALIAASQFPWIKAVVAVVPSDLVWEGWGGPGPKTASFSFDGKPLPFQPYDDIEREIAAQMKGDNWSLARAHADGRTKFPLRVAAARIPIERYQGALLVIGGGEDRVWPSASMAQNIASTRKRAGLATEILIFPQAGHSLAGPGTEPVEPLTALGGEPVAIARGREKAWKATFELFHSALMVHDGARSDK